MKYNDEIKILERHISVYKTFWTGRSVKTITIIYFSKKFNRILNHHTQFYYDGLTREERFG